MGYATSNVSKPLSFSVRSGYIQDAGNLANPVARFCSCVRRLESHVNRQQHVGLNFSPCLRYVATGRSAICQRAYPVALKTYANVASAGSEDKQCYMYDLGKGVFIEKIGGHTDVVRACLPRYKLLTQP